MSKLRTLVAAVLVALTALPAAAQTGGTIAGRVTDAQTNAALSGANVSIGGTTRRTVTNAQGEYRLSGVPAGTYGVSVALIGREGSTRQVRVVSGETATVNFVLGASAVTIEGLVVTATGEQARAREVGVSVGRVNVAEDVQLAAVSDVTQVLQGRTAGVSVLQSSGTAGTGARIRIRGSNSVSLSNDPLLIIDGVRSDISVGGSGLLTGGQSTSRLSDLNPEEIESLEVLKGPAASALYGTAAANGVLVVTTKKGRAGRTQFRVYTEQGRVSDVTDFPANYSAVCSFARTPTPTNPATRTDYNACFLTEQAEPAANGLPGDIRRDSVLSFNPLEDPRSSPFETGESQKYGISASGGTERVTYFLSGDLEDEGGVYKYDLNTLQRRSVRANLRSQLSSNFDLALNTGYTNSDVRLPRNDNEATGITSAALLSTRVRYDSINQGYGFSVTPRELSAINARENVNRLTGSLTANYRPLSWLSLSGQAGLDAVDRAESQLIPPGFIRNSTANFEGSRAVFRNRGTAYTANGNATANFGLGERITGSTSAGVQYNEDVIRGNYSFGAVLLPGVGSLTGTNARFAVDEQNFHVRTVGGYFQQQIALNDRFFLTGAVRADRNSAFGSDFGFVYYPSVTTSWVVREEPWFPEISALTSLRLRAAYGTSGLRPGVTDAFTFFTPVTASVGAANVAAFTAGGTGNTRLRPEKSSEVEFGFDAGLFGDRIGLDVTYFDKTANDALVNVRLAPSLGLTATRRLNLGSVNNRGLEMQLNTRLVERGNVRWDATVTDTRLRNELKTLGDAVAPIEFGLGGNSQRHTPGRPLGSYYAREYTYEDSNNDGIIALSEITFADTATYQGNPFPTREASFQSNLQVGIFRLSGLLDYRGGFQQFNSTEEFRCGFANCQGLYDPTASLENQARALATYFEDTPSGYMEDGDFVKLRELSLTAGLPNALAERFGAKGVSLTLAGRNLKTWTEYSGFDPEINFAGSSSNFSTAEFLTQPPARTVTLRLDMNF